jgi:sigma-B regulation protein RsbU (phosphoserine phosphatase)
MATSRALIRGLSSKRISLAERITEVNRLLAADVRQTGNFMSLFLLELESGSRTIKWVRAGHDPAILFDPAAKRFEELRGSGIVLGADEEYTFQQLEKTIGGPGTVILIGTDGIWEAHNSEGEMFGKKRLCEIIRNNGDKSSETILDAVLDAVTEFRGDMAQEDDVTLVVIRAM